MAMPCSCGDLALLRALLDDSLPAEEQADLMRHLESCETCRAAFDGIAAEGRWWNDLRCFGGPVSDPHTPWRGAGEELPPAKDADRMQADDAGCGGPSLEFLSAPESPGKLGRFGPFEVLEILGQGGMGVVLKAFDPALHRLVAVKVLSTRLAAGAAARRRFVREARAAASVVHDHVVTIHAVDEVEGLPYLVMQLVVGKSLQERIDRTGPLEVEEILRIGMQVAQGLDAAHTQGLVHRDIKPSNILLENGVERVKITDFGLARAVDDASLTQSGTVAGTPQYMAPEQAGGHAVDRRADLFSLGSVLYAMCTGRSPFRADSTMAVLRRVCEHTPRPVREVNHKIPARLAELIERLHAKNPADRYQDAAEVATLLARQLAVVQQPPEMGELERTAPQASPEAGPERRRRWPAAAILLALGAVAASAALGFSPIGEILATVLKIRTAEGILVLKVSDPQIRISIDGEDVVVTEAGVRELRLRPGIHRVRTLREGEQLSEESVTITRGGKQTLSVGLEVASAPPDRRGAETDSTAVDQAERRAAEREVEHAEEIAGQAAFDRQSLETEFGRVEKLSMAGSATALGFEEARARLEIAAAAERVAAANLSLAKARVRTAGIRMEAHAAKPGVLGPGQAGSQSARRDADREVASAVVVLAEAELDRAAAELKCCDKAHSLVLKLAETGAAPATEVERRQDGLKKARAAVQSAELRLRNAKKERVDADATARHKKG